MIFLSNFAQKTCFWSKTEKNEHHHWILHIRISLGTKFQLKLTILIFWIEFVQKVFPVKNRKSEQHHWILHIRISLGTKFQLKLTILIFLTKFAQKGKNEKIAFVRASMVVSYHVKHFRTGAERHNGILMSLLLLVGETKTIIRLKHWFQQLN